MMVVVGGFGCFFFFKIQVGCDSQKYLVIDLCASEFDRSEASPQINKYMQTHIYEGLWLFNEKFR